jgi:N-acetylglucosaminyldiphosphoundecaprenol N-acetyl-beta-D-mannosaminyltransferase
MDRNTSPLALTRVEVLGVPVDLVDMPVAIDQVRQMIAGQATNLILAVNPEKVVAAQKDPALLDALRAASMVIPDGIGVVMAARLLGKGHLARVPGSDLMPAICELAAREGHSVFLYGAKEHVVAKAATILQERYPGLRVAGFHHGYVLDDEMPHLIDAINGSGADILFVGLGSPRQELWLHRHRGQLNVRVCQGVGGTFDAICGHPKRAPALLRRIHLEWLYRLVTQPQRLRRQTALPSFVAQVFRELLSRKWRTSP